MHDAGHLSIHPINHFFNNFPHGPYIYKNRVDNPISVRICTQCFLHLLCMSACCGLTVIVSFIHSSPAGAMRLPGGIDEDVGNKHYLTNAYVNLFGLKKIPFLNSTDKGYYHLYGINYLMSGEISKTCQSQFILLIKLLMILDWKKNSEANCTRLWPHWDEKLTPEAKKKYEIDGLGE